ncbi:MAG: PSD1 and planctomycete cytochrome C domain-containing protein [Verrucomicrobiota bacterium]
MLPPDVLHVITQGAFPEETVGCDIIKQAFCMMGEFISRTYCLPLLVAVVFCGQSVKGQPFGNRTGTEYFETKVRPLLVKHCYECHSEQEQKTKGGLLLDRESGWLDGGDTGKAVIPGEPEASLLIEVVRRIDEDYAMPPKYPLSEEEVNILVRWVKGGAPGPKEDMGETEFSQLGDQTAIFAKAADHWSFQELKQPALPEVKDPEWKKNPIDRFIYGSLQEKGLAPSKMASRPVVTRRLAYALTGLPPEFAEQKTLNPVQQIDQLLESPHFGEHMARMWLDVARYGDTANTNSPAPGKPPYYYPFAFTYRDYVIEAFNEDKPFNRFVKEQLAADLMPFENKRAPELAALGFLGVTPHRTKNADMVDDLIDATTRGFLGMTVSCARCHDHKFEPVPTADYYSLYGVFNSVEKPQPWEDQDHPIIDGYTPSEADRAEYLERRKVISQRIAEASENKSANNNRTPANDIRHTDLAELLLTHEGAPARAMAVSESARPFEPAVFIRGNSGNRGERIPRRFLKILDPEQPAFTKENSGRLDLAHEIVEESNPLTARVYVNRVWGFLMGDYIVDTPSDFGLQGLPPSHSELLDYLAVEFIESGWSTKHLVKLIASSRTFLQSSASRPEAEAIDPENQIFWRANRKRLRIEELRDSLLAVSEELDRTLKGRSEPLWGEGATVRRSIYGMVDRLNLDPTLRNFDFPSPTETQGSRTENIVAPQALFLMNSDFVVERSQALVGSLGFNESMNREDRIQSIYHRVLQRPASPAEKERISRFVDIEKERKVNAWPLVAQALCMSNEFLYVD